jgi:hypothetical protein
VAHAGDSPQQEAAYYYLAHRLGRQRHSHRPLQPGTCLPVARRVWGPGAQGARQAARGRWLSVPLIPVAQTP